MTTDTDPRVQHDWRDWVLRVTTAYEQGFGHATRTELANPYFAGTPEHEAWDQGREIGAQKAAKGSSAPVEAVAASRKIHPFGGVGDGITNDTAVSQSCADSFATTPPKAEPDSRQNCRNLTVGKDGECVHCYAKAGQECQYEPASDDALSDRYVEQRKEIARLTEEIADEKAVVDVLRSELQDRLQKQRAAEVELQEAQKDAGRYRWLREQAWFAGPLCVLRDPKDILTRGAFLGADCPSLSRLDDAIDAAMTKEK